jgi:hypothetical protein
VKYYFSSVFSEYRARVYEKKTYNDKQDALEAIDWCRR